MFPLRDENPRVHFPYATIAIIAVNALVWLLVQGLGSQYALAESLCLYGLVPGDLLGNLAPPAGEAPPSGALLFSCNGRGIRMWPEEGAACRSGNAGG